MGRPKGDPERRKNARQAVEALIAKGWARKTIAARLRISAGTIWNVLNDGPCSDEQAEKIIRFCETQVTDPARQNSFDDFLKNLAVWHRAATEEIDSFVGTYRCYRMGISWPDTIVETALVIEKDGDTVLFREHMNVNIPPATDIHSKHEYRGVVTQTYGYLTFTGHRGKHAKLMVTGDIACFAGDAIDALMLMFSPQINGSGACRALLCPVSGVAYEDLVGTVRIYAVSEKGLPDHVVKALPRIANNVCGDDVLRIRGAVAPKSPEF